jgi:DNA polymerase I
MLKSLFGPQRRVLLLDWSNVAWRALGVADDSPEKFLRLLVGMISKYRKLFKTFDLVVALEGDGAELRRRLYPAYKANRKHSEHSGTLLELASQVLKCLAGTVIRSPRGEADDAIASYLSQQIGVEDHAIVVSEDRDLWALVRDPSVEVHSTRLGVKLDEGWVLEKLGVKPQRVRLLKALLGDASDNLPKVPRLSKQTALRLIQGVDTLEKLWRTAKAAKWLTKSERDALQRCKAMVGLNYRVCGLKRKLRLSQRVQKSKPRRLLTLLVTHGVFGFDLAAARAITEGA